jgi:hypothetical protein
MSKSAMYGSSSRIDPVHTRLCAKAEFEDFAPMPCNCLGFCVADAQRERQYAHVYENRMEANHPIAPFCCLTKEICIIDQIWVSYFDRPPVRAGMCCFCIPATCCGPPVLFVQSPKCGPIDLAPCFGQQIKAAPCNCFGLKAFLVCGNPCYVKSSVGLFGGLKVGGSVLHAGELRNGGRSKSNTECATDIVCATATHKVSLPPLAPQTERLRIPRRLQGRRRRLRPEAQHAREPGAPPVNLDRGP